MVHRLAIGNSLGGPISTSGDKECKDYVDKVNIQENTGLPESLTPSAIARASAIGTTVGGGTSWSTASWGSSAALCFALEWDRLPFCRLGGAVSMTPSMGSGSGVAA